MKSSIGLAAVTFAAALAAAPATAATFTTVLSGANETTPNASTATGAGTLILSTDRNKIKVNASWAGLSGPATIGHAHCCALQGANGPVAIDFEPPNVATGALSRFYDLTDIATYGGGFLAANGGTAASARLAFLAGLEGGGAYYNIHSALYPGGEIRGNLAAVAVPEPAAWAMLIPGFGLTGALMRRRRHTAIA